MPLNPKHTEIADNEIQTKLQQRLAAMEVCEPLSSRRETQPDSGPRHAQTFISHNYRMEDCESVTQDDECSECSDRAANHGSVKSNTKRVRFEPYRKQANVPPKLEQDIATFGHAKKHKEKFIPRLNINDATAISPELRQKLRGTLAGQDYSLVLHPMKDARNTLQLTMDGHGSFGELYAVLAGEYLASKLEQHWDQITTLAHTLAGFEAAGGEDLVTNLFAETDEYLRGELAAEYDGGTTATICMIINGCTVITVNVGDTPAMLILENGSYQMLTTAHSADSPEEYARYRARCSKLGVKHHEFVYNRFNCPGGPSVPGPDGSFAPLPIFRIENEQAVPIPEHCAYVERFGYHGGVQSIRKHVVKDATGAVIGTQPDKRHCNWGSTVAGRPQNTRMLGDFEDKKLLHLDAKPSINVVQLDRSCGRSWLLVASDGITDANWFHEIAGRLVQRAQGVETSAQHLCQALVLDTIENAREHEFKFSKEKNMKGEFVEYPAWDDMCATLIELSACA